MLQISSFCRKIYEDANVKRGLLQYFKLTRFGFRIRISITSFNNIRILLQDVIDALILNGKCMLLITMAEVDANAARMLLQNLMSTRFDFRIGLKAILIIHVACSPAMYEKMKHSETYCNTGICTLFYFRLYCRSKCHGSYGCA